MKLSTSTNILEDARENGEMKLDVLSVEECIESCAEAGYKYIDINFDGLSRPGNPLTRDGWKDWVYGLKSFSDKIGVEFNQSHAYFYNHAELSPSEIKWREELVQRSIIASGIMGVKWVVMHPMNVADKVWYSYEESLKYNLEYFKGHIELVKENNVGIAIENMIEPKKGRRYATSTEELIELVDTIDDPSVGICWDFGHANISGLDQVEALRAVGKRLKATHVNDNHGETDEHLAPYYGNINWNEIMSVLKEIEYEGDFAFEIHHFTDVLPATFRKDILKFTFALGNHLLEL